jgi:hypothetical protein
MEPERPIEKKLRDYGKSRCERTGDLRLHSATRRLLQGEVARTYGAPREGQSRFFGFWPKVVWSGGLLAVVLFVAIVSSRGPETGYQLAGKPRNAELDKTLDLLTAEPTREKDASVAPLTVTAPERKSYGVSEQPEAKSKGMSSGEVGVPLTSPVSPAERQGAVVVGTLPASAASSPSLVMRERAVAAPTQAIRGAVAGADRKAAQTLADRIEPKRELAAGRLAAGLAVTNGVSEFAQAGSTQFGFTSQVASSPTVAYQRIDSNAGPELRQKVNNEGTRFLRRSSTELEQSRTESFMANQSYVRTPTPQGMGAWSTANNEARMLSNFRMQQTDGRLEVVDEDGSVYTGQVELVATNAPVSGGYYAGAKIDVAENAVPEEPALLFHVTGTNKSLNQAIVFSGQILPQTAALNNQSSGLNKLNSNNVQLGLSGGSNQMLNNSQGLNNSQLLNNQLQWMPMLQNSRISGKVRVGSEETIIDATPRNP